MCTIITSILFPAASIHTEGFSIGLDIPAHCIITWTIFIMILAVIPFTCTCKNSETCSAFSSPSSTSLLFSPRSTKTTESIRELVVNADLIPNHQHGIAKNSWESLLQPFISYWWMSFDFDPTIIEWLQQPQPCHLCYNSLMKVHQDDSLSIMVWNPALKNMHTSSETLIRSHTEMTEQFLYDPCNKTWY